MSMKDNDYLCPKCKGHLNVGNYLVLATQTQRKHKGLILLSHKIGEYKYKHHPKYLLAKGEMVDFRCPLCQTDLTSTKNKDHAMIYMVSEDDNFEYELYFSKIAGKQSTYLVAHDNVEAFGEDAMDYEDLFFE